MSRYKVAYTKIVCDLCRKEITHDIQFAAKAVKAWWKFGDRREEAIDLCGECWEEIRRKRKLADPTEQVSTLDEN